MSSIPVGLPVVTLGAWSVLHHAYVGTCPAVRLIIRSCNTACTAARCYCLGCACTCYNAYTCAYELLERASTAAADAKQVISGRPPDIQAEARAQRLVIGDGSHLTTVCSQGLLDRSRVVRELW